MFMVYKWKSNSRIKCDAQVAGEFLEKIEREKGLTATNLLDASRDENSPLHDEFEWDDSIAAEEYRKTQAAYIIRHIEVVIRKEENQEETTRAFFVIKQDENAQSYKPITVIMQNKDDAEQLYQQALRELQAFRRKYSTIQKLTNIFKVIDEEAYKSL